jgi:hypothetical protein
MKGPAAARPGSRGTMRVLNHGPCEQPAVLAQSTLLSPALQGLTGPLRRRGQACALFWSSLWPVLAVLMLLAQMLGQWHGLAHAPHGAHAAAEAARQRAGGHADDHGADHADGHTASHTAFSSAGHGGALRTGASWLQQLFDGDEHLASCVLYDQLAHADGLPSLPMLWLPPAWVPAVPPWHARWQLAAQATGFLARGPPSRA